tara:strand:- start:139 stop:696 length:558 start_codon:yes stop_codon:yes gene_type:complete
MKRLLTAVIAASMLLPTATLASSTRPGSFNHGKLNANKNFNKAKCPVEEKLEVCEITIDETGVIGPVGHITDVVQWTTEEKEFNVAGSVVGGAAGATAGFAAGLGSCMILGPFCLITAPTIMGAGMGGGATLGGKGTGRFFTIVGDDAQGNRLIQEFYYGSGKQVKSASKSLLKTTTLAEGEVKQ